MDSILDLIGSLVGSLAWPTVAILAIFVFRGEVGPLLSQLHKIRIGGLELRFFRDLYSARLQAESLSETEMRESRPTATLTSYDSENGLDWNRLSPSQRIVKAFVSVEKALSDAAERLDLAQSYGGRRSTFEILPLLRSGEHLSEDWARLVRQLRDLNQTAIEHRFEVTHEDAEHFSTLCADVIRHAKMIGSSSDR